MLSLEGRSLSGSPFLLGVGQGPVEALTGQVQRGFCGVTSLRPGSSAGHLRELRLQWRAQDSLRLAAAVLGGDHIYLKRSGTGVLGRTLLTLSPPSLSLRWFCLKLPTLHMAQGWLSPAHIVRAGLLPVRGVWWSGAVFRAAPGTGSPTFFKSELQAADQPQL